MLKQDWFAAAEDELHPRLYPKGTVLTGELLDRARGLGLVEDAPGRARPQRTRAAEPK